MKTREWVLGMACKIDFSPTKSIKTNERKNFKRLYIVDNAMRKESSSYYECPYFGMAKDSDFIVNSSNFWRSWGGGW